MHTEDDTFNRLKRSTYESLIVDFQHEFKEYLAGAPAGYWALKRLDIMQKHGWTEQEYIIELGKRI